MVDGIPFNKQMIADVVAHTWNTYVIETGKFTIPQVCFTYAEVTMSIYTLSILFIVLLVILLILRMAYVK